MKRTPIGLLPLEQRLGPGARKRRAVKMRRRRNQRILWQTSVPARRVRRRHLSFADLRARAFPTRTALGRENTSRLAALLVEAAKRVGLGLALAAVLSGCVGSPAAPTPPAAPPAASPVRITLNASAASVAEGASVVLTWSVAGAETCALDGAPVPCGSSARVTPAWPSTTWRLTAAGAGGTEAAAVTVAATRPAVRYRVVGSARFLAIEWETPEVRYDGGAWSLPFEMTVAAAPAGFVARLAASANEFNTSCFAAIVEIDGQVRASRQACGANASVVVEAVR